MVGWSKGYNYEAVFQRARTTQFPCLRFHLVMRRNMSPLWPIPSQTPDKRFSMHNSSGKKKRKRKGTIDYTVVHGVISSTPRKKISVYAYMYMHTSLSYIAMSRLHFHNNLLVSYVTPSYSLNNPPQPQLNPSSTNWEFACIIPPRPEWFNPSNLPMKSTGEWSQHFFFSVLNFFYKRQSFFPPPFTTHIYNSMVWSLELVGADGPAQRGMGLFDNHDGPTNTCISHVEQLTDLFPSQTLKAKNARAHFNQPNVPSWFRFIRLNGWQAKDEPNRNSLCTNRFWTIIAWCILRLLLSKT